MTHLHIPDGILPLWLWGGGLLLMAAVLAISLYRLRHMDRKRMVPLLGVLSASMLVAMSIEIAPIAYHINLSVVSGILLGPSLGFCASFITNLMLALMGHGGITVIGLNTLLLGFEAMLGHTVFYLLGARVPVFWRSAIAAVAALMASSLLLIGLVAASPVDPALFSHEHEHVAAGGRGIDIGRFAVLVLALGSVGWVLEAVITGSVIRFISQVKPDLLDHRLHIEKSGSGT